MECNICGKKLRKFRGGLICNNNHKFPAVNEPKLKKRLCPLCQTEVVSMCMCPIGELRCVNNHVWTKLYYQGDKRYLCEFPPDDNLHVFKF